MKITFTKNFIFRLFIGMIFSTLFLASIFTLFQKNFQNNFEEEKFKPIERIDYLTNISIDSKAFFFNFNDKKNFSNNELYQISSQQSSVLKNNLNELGCNIRQKALVFSNVFSEDKKKVKYEKSDYVDFLNQTIRRYYLNKNISCAVFINDINFLIYLTLLGLDVRESKSRIIIENYLTEHTSWSWMSPCIYFRELDGDFNYLSGSIANCFSNKKFKKSSKFNLTNEIKPIGNILQRQLSIIPEKNFKYFNDKKNFFLTIDPYIQSWLNLYKKCFESLEMCDFLSVKSLSKMNNLSVVIMDRDDSSILGVICVGPKCNNSGLSVYGDLASLYINSPPASISKLFYALAFSSSNKIDKKVLQRQIKTSGQLNPIYGKRNEWWEKKAICDGTNYESCNNVQNVIRFAKIFGISTDCPVFFEYNYYKRLNELTGNFYCGRISLAKSNHLSNYPFSQNTISGFMGFLPLTDRFYLDSVGVVRYVDWIEYEQIRRNKNLTSQKKEFLNTSNVIQSVLGGGESRISALGIASIGAQISQLSNYQKPILPSLVRTRSDKTNLELNISKRVISNSDFKAAKNVISGMQKVILSSEEGWKGNGTAYNSFKDIFKKNCSKDCPIQGKTGTVSYQDKNFYGTTLFSGIVNSKKMKRELKTNKNIQNLAIGVIVFSEKNSSDGHYASQLFMSLIKDLFSEQEPSELTLINRSLINEKFLLKNENR